MYFINIFHVLLQCTIYGFFLKRSETYMFAGFNGTTITLHHINQLCHLNIHFIHSCFKLMSFNCMFLNCTLWLNDVDNEESTSFNLFQGWNVSRTNQELLTCSLERNLQELLTSLYVDKAKVFANMMIDAWKRSYWNQEKKHTFIEGKLVQQLLC